MVESSVLESDHVRRKPLDILGFGSHLVIDGFQAAPELLEDEDHIARVVESLGRLLEPLPLSRQRSSHDDGLSELVILAEAHLTLHTFLLQGCVSLSIFSRKTLHLQDILNVLSEGFDIGRYESYLTRRSKTYQNGADLEALIRGERSYVSARLDDTLIG